MLKINWFLVSLISFISNPASNQNILKAIVKDEKTKEPIFGANLIQSGTNLGASSDINGLINLETTQTGIIQFEIRYTGYQPKSISIEIPQKNAPFEILLAENISELSEVVVTTVRTNSRIENIPTRIEVLGLEEMDEESGIKPGNISSILGDIAGIQMQQVSASTGNTYARIQGLNGRYTQILKDGIPLFGGLSGSFGILQIPPLDLKQIEIIKGSCSTLYGGDAIGGIINLISKLPTEKQELSFVLNQSTLSESNFNMYSAKRLNKFGYTFFTGYTNQRQVDVDKDGLSDVPKTKTFVIHPKLIYYFDKKSNLTFNYTGTFDHRTGGDINYFQNTNVDTLYFVETKSNRHNADLKFTSNLSSQDNLEIKASANFLDQQIKNKYYDFGSNQYIYYSEASVLHKSKNMDWVLGLNFNGDRSTKKTSNLFQQLEDTDFKTLGAFVQNTYKPTEKLILESGFRFDYQNKYKEFLLPRISLLYKINKQFTGRINAGLGYKIPTAITYINPESDLLYLSKPELLKAEHSQGIHADLNYQKNFSNEFSFTFNQSFFYTNLNNPVIDSSSQRNRISLINAIGPLRTSGFQSYSRIKFKDLENYFGYVYTYVKKVYDLKEAELPVTPKHNFSDVIIWELADHLKIGIETSFIAGQKDQDYHPTKNYLIMAALVQYTFANFNLVLNGENLLDFRQNKYERIYDGSISDPQFHLLWAPIDGRVINLSLKWKLK